MLISLKCAANSVISAGQDDYYLDYNKKTIATKVPDEQIKLTKSFAVFCKFTLKFLTLFFSEKRLSI